MEFSLGRWLDSDASELLLLEVCGWWKMGLLLLRDWSIGFVVGSHFGWDSGSVFVFAVNGIRMRPRNCV